MKYELIIFDADDTLFDFHKGEEQALIRIKSHYGIDYDQTEYINEYRVINKKVWDEFERELITAEELKIERHRRLFEKLGVSIDPKEFSVKYLDVLSEMAFLFTDAEEILRELNKKYKLVLVTNGLARVQRSRLEKALLMNYFDAIIISEEIGVAKPNVEIFEHAFEKARHKDKSTALIVGDSLKSDIKGGLNYGIDTCWFNPNGKENDTDIKPKYEIKSLKELENIIK